MVVRRVGPLSCAKIGGAMYALMGLIAGIFFSLFAMAIGSAADADTHAGPMFGAIFGVGAIVLMPIFYGVLGFVMTLISAFIYNALAGMVGGIELEVESNTGLTT